MNTLINSKQLRATLPEVVANVRKGARYTVLYRSRPAFQLVPVDDGGPATGRVEEDSLHRAPALGRSVDGRSAADHDRDLYRK